jgi:hypothetical protein
VVTSEPEPSQTRITVATILGIGSGVATLLVLQKAFHLSGGSFVGWIIPAVIVGALVFSAVKRFDF